MRETVKRCNICKDENCDGKEYAVIGSYDMYGINIIDIVLCTRSTKHNTDDGFGDGYGPSLVKKDGQFGYVTAIAHGCWSRFPAFPLFTEEGRKMAEEARKKLPKTAGSLS